MQPTITVILSLVIAIVGVTYVSLRQPKAFDRLIYQNPEKPIMDFDDGGGRTFEQDKPRIDRFAKAMIENGSADAYIIAYGGLVSYKNEAKIRLNCTREYLMAAHGIPPSRLKLIDAGYRPEATVQLLLVKPGDPKPDPFTIVRREAVRMTKAPKYPCGKPVKVRDRN